MSDGGGGLGGVVTEVLGHSSYALTMDTYTHVLPAVMRDAAAAMDRALWRPAPEQLGGQTARG